MGKLKVKDQITLFSSIRNFLNNGFSLEEAIDFYTVMNSDLRKPINYIKQSLASGKNFSESVKPLINFRTYCQLRIAEFHGNLLNALDNIGKFLKLKQNQRKKILGLLIYPLFLLGLLMVILIGIRILVTPQLQMSNNEPSLNKWLWVTVALIPILILAYGGWRYYYEQSRVWQINHLLKLPLIGKIFQSYYAYYFSSNLALMMSCGMDLKQIVNFMESFKSSSLIQDLSLDLRKAIDRGYQFKRLRRKYHFLPLTMILLLNTGDTNPVIAQKLRSYSRFEFKLMMKQSSRIIAMMQPVMFLIIGMFIAGTYLSMLLPMYQSIKGVY